MSLMTSTLFNQIEIVEGHVHGISANVDSVESTVTAVQDFYLTYRIMFQRFVECERVSGRRRSRMGNQWRRLKRK